MGDNSISRWHPTRTRVFLGVGVLVLCAVPLTYFLINGGFSASATTDPAPPKKRGPLAVSVVKVKKAVFERVTVQPGSILAFQAVLLYARASGYLKDQKNLDIGDTVKKGQVLAILDVPDLEKQVSHQKAVLETAEARVKQLKAKVNTEKADLESARAAVTEAEAKAKSAAAWVRYREKKLNRLQKLLKTTAVPESLVDEAQEQYEASVETETAAKSGILTTKSQVNAHTSKVDQAEADVTEAEAEVKVARADLEKAEVMLSFAQVTAPFDGFITHRYLDVGDFVHSAGSGGDTQPLFALAKTDVVRVVVQIPDQYVPYANKGDKALVEITAFPGKPFEATISRIAQSEDPKTRYMHVEIDLPNPDQKIVPGMYAKVTIILDRIEDHVALPQECLSGKTQGDKGKVYVLKNGKARLAYVQLGLTNGNDREVVSGLKAGDEVIFSPPPAIIDGTPVVLARDEQE